MDTLPRTTYSLNTIPIKIPMVFFLEIAKNSPKICMESQDSNIQSNSEKKNKAVAITFTDFKLNYK